MFIYIFLFISITLFCDSYASFDMVENVLEKESIRRQGPLKRLSCAQNLYSLLYTPHKNVQHATVRSGRIGKLSPGKITPIKSERNALRKFAGYMAERLPTEANKKLQRTPLNAHTVLAAAAKSIKVGSNEHFSSYMFFTPKGSGIEQLILQCSSIDTGKKDLRGRTNIDRMERGHAPLGSDSEPMELHHICQTNGLLAELSNATHKRWYNVLHYNTKKTSSINRKEFNTFRREYWKVRAASLKSGNAHAHKTQSLLTEFLNSPEVEPHSISGEQTTARDNQVKKAQTFITTFLIQATVDESGNKENEDIQPTKTARKSINF